jgi:hypothetical protein
MSEGSLLERVRHAVAARHYSRRTEKAYLGWIRRYMAYHQGRPVSEMGEREVTQYLSGLAMNGRVSASTQNQALSALIFLYRLRGAPPKRYYVQRHVTLTASRRSAHRVPAAL